MTAYVRKFLTGFKIANRGERRLKRSELIRWIIKDHTSTVALHSIDVDTYIEESGSSQTIAKNYTNSGRSPIDIIEELAKEDPWTDETWGAIWTSSVGVSWTNDTSNSNSAHFT